MFFCGRKGAIRTVRDRIPMRCPRHRLTRTVSGTGLFLLGYGSEDPPPAFDAGVWRAVEKPGGMASRHIAP